MTEHDEQHDDSLREVHDDLLREILVGDRREDDPEVQAVLSTCKICRERLAEMRELTGHLDEMAALGPEIVAEATHERDAPGADRVENVLRRVAAESPHQPPRRPRRFFALPLVGGAAALLVLSFLMWGRFPGGSSPTGPGGVDTILGTEVVVALHPKATVSQFDRFEWQAELEKGSWVEVLIYRESAPPEETPLARSGEISESPWKPTTTESERWPDRIEWEIKVYDVLGDYQGTSGRVPASRTTP